MTVRIPEERSPYGPRRPFDVLGVDPAASATEIRDAYETEVARIDRAELEESERVGRLAELKAAYDVLREPRTRALAEMFLVDEEPGRDDCRNAARAHEAASLECEGVLECEEGLPAAEPPLEELPAGPSRVASLAARMRLRTEGARFLPDPEREIVESIRFER